MPLIAPHYTIKQLPRTVIVLGVVSLLNDLASDMVIPLIPILLTSQLAAGPIALGLIEGIADAIASYLKLWSGRHSDLLGQRRKTLTVIGYALSNLARPLLGVAGTWVQLLALRCIDRVGKGIRTAPRDALLADLIPPQSLGFAFGFHRALDNAGAVAGSLLAGAILAWSTLSLEQVVLWSCIPGLAGVLLAVLAVKEGVSIGTRVREPLPSLAWRNLSPRLQNYLLLLGLFTFARVSETFIVLLGRELGMEIVQVLILWSALNLAKALSAAWGGRLADRVGKAAVMRLSWAAYALAFGGFGWASSASALWITTLAYGLFAGLSEGGERALIGTFAAPREKGTAYGWYNMVLGFAAIPAGLVFGGIWQLGGAGAAFGFAAAVAGTSVLLLHRWIVRARTIRSIDPVGVSET